MEGKNNGQRKRESSEDLYGDYGMLYGEWERNDPEKRVDLFSESSYNAIFASKAATYNVKDPEDPFEPMKKTEADQDGKKEKTADPGAQKKRDRIVFFTATGVIILTLLIAATSVQRIIHLRSQKTMDEQIEEVILQEQGLADEPFQEVVTEETMALITRPQATGSATADLGVEGWRGFVLRAGTYDSASDAEAAAGRLKNQGYAGYLVRGDSWELYSEAYLDEDEANKAASSAGTSRVDLSISAQTLTVTGSEHDVQVLSAAVAQWPGLIKSLTTAVKKAAAGDISTEEAMISVKEIETQISGTVTELQKTDVHGNLWAYEVFRMYAEADSALSDIVEEGTISGSLAWSRMRAASVGMYWNYYTIVREFTGE
ncbi:MAG: hypothetical protein IJJ34_05900 [Clostridia bacterium]|nr:hypothetical protein [Clostridia bacterium]